MGATATMGVIIGADIPMMLGAMIVGPLGGWAIKKLDDDVESKIPVSFEMQYNTFSIGILGMILDVAAPGPVACGPRRGSLARRRPCEDNSRSKSDVAAFDRTSSSLAHR